MNQEPWTKEQIDQELVRCRNAVDLIVLSRRLNDDAQIYLRQARDLHRQSKTLAVMSAVALIAALALVVLS